MNGEIPRFPEKVYQDMIKESTRLPSMLVLIFERTADLYEYDMKDPLPGPPPRPLVDALERAIDDAHGLLSSIEEKWSNDIFPILANEQFFRVATGVEPWVHHGWGWFAQPFMDSSTEWIALAGRWKRIWESVPPQLLSRVHLALMQIRLQLAELKEVYENPKTRYPALRKLVALSAEPFHVFETVLVENMALLGVLISGAYALIKYYPDPDFSDPNIYIPKTVLDPDPWFSGLQTKFIAAEDYNRTYIEEELLMRLAGPAFSSDMRDYLDEQYLGYFNEFAPYWFPDR
jgi:hypothetical protein